MSLNGHFKRFILPALLNSPAWVWLIDSVLGILGYSYRVVDGVLVKTLDGGSFLHRFKLFLGFDNETGDPVMSLPSPTGDWGFNPVWLDFSDVRSLLDTQGFSADFLSSLEMLPTGLGRLNCTSPYMFFKVLNALGVPRSRFSFLGSDFSVYSNERVVESFVWLLGDLGDNTYIYRSLSPFRDGDTLLLSDGSKVEVLSYSTEMVELGSSISLGFYSIFRYDGLFPMVDGGRLLMWSYPLVPSQLVYDRYTPLHLYGTAVQLLVLGNLTVRCLVSSIVLGKKFWLVPLSELNYQFSLSPADVGVRESVLDSIAIPSSQYTFDNAAWGALGYVYGVVKQFVVLTKWLGLPSVSFVRHLYDFDISQFSYLLTSSVLVLATSESVERVLATSDSSHRAIGFRLPSIILRDLDFDVVTLFDTTSVYTFGFESDKNTIFAWVPEFVSDGQTYGAASFGGTSTALYLSAVASLRIRVVGSVASVWVDEVLCFTVSLTPSVLFNWFTPGRAVHFRWRELETRVYLNTVFFGGVARAFSLKTNLPIVSLDASEFVHPKRGGVCGTTYTLSVFDYKIPFNVTFTCDVVWSGVSFSWRIDISKSL